ncbi:hypothetical protein [Comamonas sp. B-9]|uniref:hypothetical protein n=1 Tax=Comamonas sp. B-9 TaxID=1055192 RepID=UPI00130EF8D4|nr:hypothetical protein [Comamonas sp. B-9]
MKDFMQIRLIHLLKKHDENISHTDEEIQEIWEIIKKLNEEISGIEKIRKSKAR